MTLGHELLDTELLDERPKDLVVGLDLVNLNFGLIGDEVHLSLTLFLLESEGDTSDGANLDSLHEMGGETGDFVSESLGLDNSDVIDDSLVGVEVTGKSEFKLETRQFTYFP